MVNNKKKYLNAMGIEIWQLKEQPITEPISEPTLNPILKPSPNTTTPPTQSWEELENCVNNCQLCALHKTRMHAVFGVGNKHAKLMLVGEAPGANEDSQGEPFVGRAGMLLNSMLKAINLDRNDVYIANILKCRPPNNRDPSPEEVRLCTNYLLQQIDLIKPKLIVAVGRIAAHFLLNTDESMAKLRGQKYSYGQHNTPLLITYHPAYLLRSPREKSKSYQDLLFIQRNLL